MQKKIYKNFWVWDFDKEEQWLSEMAQQGLALVSVGFCRYTFEPCAPNEYSVCVQILNHLPSHNDSQDYIKFMEETGAEYLGEVGGSDVYFRKKTADGPFELFSDNASRIKYLNRIVFTMSILLLSMMYSLFLFFRLSRLPQDGFSIFLLVFCVYATCMLLLGIIRTYRHKRKLKRQLFE